MSAHWIFHVVRILPHLVQVHTVSIHLFFVFSVRVVLVRLSSVSINTRSFFTWNTDENTLVYVAHVFQVRIERYHM